MSNSNKFPSSKDGYWVILLVILACMVFAFALKTYQPSSAGVNHVTANSTSSAVSIPTVIDGRLLGQAIDSWDTSVLSPSSSSYNTIAISTALRGPANGLIGDFYHWKDPLGVLDSRRRKTSVTSTLKVTDDQRFIWPGYITTCSTPPPGNVSEFGNLVGTLDYLRVGRDNNASLIAVVNSRGFSNWFAWLPPFGANNTYITTDLNELKELAADWVLYSHYTVQNFNQANPPSASSPSDLERRSANLLNAVQWQNCDGSNSRDKLPSATEIKVPEIIYWEIGNEPNLAMASFGLTPDQYLARYGVLNSNQYVGLTNSMVDMDIRIHGRKTIKIGPALVRPDSVAGFQNYMNMLQSNGATVDFISYHPYNAIYGNWKHVTISSSTACYTVPSGKTVERYYTVNSQQVELPDNADSWSSNDKAFLQQGIRNIQNQQSTWAGIAQGYYGNAELLVTEWNPGSWESSFFLLWRSKSIAHAFAAMESIFSFARSGVDQAYYHTYPGNGDTTSPTYRTFEFLKAHLGNQLVQIYPPGLPSDLARYDYRGYVTTNTGSGEIVLWGLNWGDSNASITFQVNNLSPLYTYNLTGYYKLEAPSLLHGAVSDVCVPTIPYKLTQPLNITWNPVSASWTTQINLPVTIPKYSWVAYTIQRIPNGPIYNTWLPLVVNSGSSGQAIASSPYPAPGSESIITGEEQVNPYP